MFSINDLRLWTAVGILSTVVALPTASAGHRHGSRCAKPDVDIEKLKARLRHTCGQWRLSVKYEVDTEDATPGRFDLIFRVTERAHGTRGRARRPVSFVVPLDRPTGVDDDELEYKGRFTAHLSHGSFRNPKRLRIKAFVVDRYTARVVEHKTKSIKYKKR